MEAVLRRLAAGPMKFLVLLLSLGALAACETTPSSPGPASPVVQGPVVGEAPPPATLPVVLAARAYTPPHMRGNGRIVRVGLLLPFSASNTAARGEASQILRAAELALFERGDDSILLLPKDTGGTPEGARQAARSALDDGADIILGPLFSASVAAVREVVAGRDLPVIAFSTDPAVAGDGIYLLSFPPAEEVRRIVDYTADLGTTRYAFIGPSTSYGQTVAEAYRTSIAQRLQGVDGEAEVTYTRVLNAGDRRPDGSVVTEDGTEVEFSTVHRQGLVAEEFYSGGVQAMNQAAARLARLGVSAVNSRRATSMTGANWQPSARPPFQVVMMPEGGDQLRTLGPVLIYHDIDPLLIKFVGTGLWRTNDMLREPALANGWFAGPDPSNRTRFDAAFEAVYAETPSRLAGLGYDAASLATLLSADGQRITRQGIEARDGFVGVDGLFRFRSSGTVERGLAVYTIGRSGFEVLDPAPTAFVDETAF